MQQSFNPRTHMGCDTQSYDDKRFYTVSIHAPTWGATLGASFNFNGKTGFNPRTHMGCDTFKHMYYDITSYVSIHAPTWGATEICNYLRLYSKVSIHAPTWGATLAHVGIDRNLLFQSTHPHGVRQYFQRDCNGTK